MPYNIPIMLQTEETGMQTIHFDFNPMMAEYVGEHGIARAAMEALSGAMRNAHAMVEAGRGKGMQGLSLIHL